MLNVGQGRTFNLSSIVRCQRDLHKVLHILYLILTLKKESKHGGYFCLHFADEIAEEYRG